MTLTVVLAVKDGMVFATDSRGTIGDPRGLTAQNDSITKQYMLTEKAVLQMSGQNETGTFLIEQIQEWCDSTGSCSTSEVMNKARDILIQKYNEWFPNMPPQPIQGLPAIARPHLNFTIGGYDIISGQEPLERIFLLSSGMNFPPQLFKTGMCMTGVPQYAIYLLHRLYSRDLSMSGATQLAAYVITETATQDGKVGGPLQIIQMEKVGKTKELNTDEINDVIERDKEVIQKLKDLFK